MYYTVEETSLALNEAKTIIDSRTKEVDAYTRGYNDCFAFLAEYDKALRGKDPDYNLDLNYKTTLEFFQNIRKGGYRNLREFAIAAGYEVIRNSKTMHGDIAFEHSRKKGGSAMIAEGRFWTTTCELNTGIQTSRRRLSSEGKLGIIARPIKGI